MELFESTKPENQIRSNRKPNINQKKTNWNHIFQIFEHSSDCFRLNRRSLGGEKYTGASSIIPVNPKNFPLKNLKLFDKVYL